MRSGTIARARVGVPNIVVLNREPISSELHSDAMLLERGSRQENLWGANYFPGLGEAECIEFTSLINIRPAQDNRSMEIADERIRARVRGSTGRSAPPPR